LKKQTIWTESDKENLASLGYNTGSFKIDNVIVPEGCSLFNSVVLGWDLQTSISQVSMGTIHLSQVNREVEDNPKNGLWLHLHSEDTSSSSIVNKLFFHITLFEKNVVGVPEKDKPVTFCEKCNRKREEVIMLREKRMTSSMGSFEAVININEQCAHRSKNSYGTPSTRFYFKIRLCERVMEEGIVNMKEIASDESTLILVVAPGKSKQPTLRSKKVPNLKATQSKPSMRQMMETIFASLQGFEDRLTQLEKRVNECPTIKGEMKLEENLPETSQRVDTSIRGIKQIPQTPNLRRSCEFSFPEEESFLTLSQEMNLMMNDSSFGFSP